MRRWVLVAVVLSVLVLCSCAGGPRASSRAGAGATGASVRLALAPGLKLIGLRVAVDYEIRYLNARPARHPPSAELARLEPGACELVVEATIAAGPGGTPETQRLAWTVQVPAGGEPSLLTITVQRSRARGGARPALGLRARGARTGLAKDPTPPACKTLNPDLHSCAAAADPPARALCVIRAVRALARQKLNPGWMGCASHQGNRLRTARQLHANAKEALFARSAQLEAQARACVKQYFICD